MACVLKCFHKLDTFVVYGAALGSRTRRSCCYGVEGSGGAAQAEGSGGVSAWAGAPGTEATRPSAVHGYTAGVCPTDSYGYACRAAAATVAVATIAAGVAAVAAAFATDATIA